MQATTPIRYVGKAKAWRDHLYGSGIVFKRNVPTPTPNFAAANLLKHPEFQDARPEKMRTPIPYEERPETEADRAMRDHLFFEQTIRTDQMSREQLANFAMRGFGVRLNHTDPKVDVASEVRSLMRQRRE